MMRYCSLFSGSSGNSTYVATSQGGVLVDVGVSAKRIVQSLEEREIDPRSIKAVLITHEHTDHVAGLRVLCKRFGWPVLASKGTLDALAQNGVVHEGQRLYALTEDAPISIGELRVTPFYTPHDSRSSMGFRFDSADRSMAVATDMGYMMPTVMEHLRGCQLVHIESNHDPDMLRNGTYPYSLQKRILGDFGHLSNDACAAVLPQLVRDGTTRLVLAHLSEQNNTPPLAYRTAEHALNERGIAVGRDCLLSVAQPTGTQAVTYF
ncbi:MAG: MBL fold metallo-hydrolase [Clostridia bacterium]|nr:MBL fold metallo-hydrolase [Clostridia bacterium]